MGLRYFKVIDQWLQIGTSNFEFSDDGLHINLKPAITTSWRFSQIQLILELGSSDYNHTSDIYFYARIEHGLYQVLVYINGNRITRNNVSQYPYAKIYSWFIDTI